MKIKLNRNRNRGKQTEEKQHLEKKLKSDY